MKRRNLLAMSAGLAATSLPFARRSFAVTRTVGWISVEPPATIAPFLAAFKAGLLAARGGDQVRVVDRNVTTGADGVAAAVDDLQRQGVSLLVAQGAATPIVARLKPSLPVVFGFSGDPVVAGIVRSLARPGGNFTGMTFMSVELNAKRIDLLRAALPDCRRLGLLSNSMHPGEENEIAACQRAVQPAGIALHTYRVKGAAEVQSAVTRALDDGIHALIALPSSTMVRHSASISAQCLARRVPVASGWASMARDGALLTYGPNLAEAYKRVAQYAMRVLGGAKPSDLPVEQPSVLELVINMKIAAALGLRLPPSLLAQANEVVE